MKTKILSLLAVGLLAGPNAAQAAYKYTIVDYPGAQCTVLWGINNSGDVLGSAGFSADCSGTTISFVYHPSNGSIALLPTVPGVEATFAIGINQKGVMVGSAGTSPQSNNAGLILNQGAFTFFVHPGAVNTEGRAIGNSGLVTGYFTNSDGDDVPFIYDPTRNTFIDITIPGMIPGRFNTAQGINGKGEAVGSFILDDNVVYPDSPPGAYGFLRDRLGAITLFRVNGYRTRARGITESGRIVGFLTDDNERNRGFVTRLPGRGSLQSLTVPDADLLDVPGSANTYAAGIDELGRISGSFDDAQGTHGYLATPLRPSH